MPTEERIQAIIKKITEMKENKEDMTEALSLLGVNINAEE